MLLPGLAPCWALLLRASGAPEELMEPLPGTNILKFSVRLGLIDMSVLYGIHAVAEALKANPERIERICVERGQRNPRIQEIVKDAQQKHVRIAFEEKSWLDRKAEGSRHQGVLCYASEMDTLDSEDILDQAKSPGLLIVLDGIEDPHNLGAILRSADAAGADGIFIPRHRSAGLSATVAKASAGATAHVKVARVPNISQLIESLKKRGFWVVGLDAVSDTPIWKTDLTGPTVLILGSEGSGLHRLVREKCDFVVSLPICGHVNSYNVSVSAGMALYEVLRQRAMNVRK
jgi:23S rRNA (guanosine2251-2'-O)-methyltransferase